MQKIITLSKPYSWEYCITDVWTGGQTNGGTELNSQDPPENQRSKKVEVFQFEWSIENQGYVGLITDASAYWKSFNVEEKLGRLEKGGWCDKIQTWSCLLAVNLWR